MANKRVVVEFLGKDKSLSKTANDAANNTGKLKSRVGAVGKAAALGFGIAGAAAGTFAVKAIRGASDLEETVNKSNVIFGKQAAEIDKWSKGAATSMGLSRQAALEAAAGFGDMFKQLGFGGAEAAKMSKSTVQLSADLGSFNNLPTEDVSQRIAAAFRGEYDSLQQLIPNINAARVEKEALAATGKKNAKALTAEEKAAAVLAIVNKDGARAQGDFAKTSGGLANQQKILGARFKNLSDTVGAKLLPVATKLVTWANDKMLPAFSKVSQFLSKYLGPAFEKIRNVIKGAMGGSSGDVGKAFANIKSIITSAVSIIQSLWTTFGATIITFTKAAFGNIKQIIGGALNVIAGIFKVVSSLLKGDWKGVWDGIKQIVKGAWTVIKGIVNLGWNVIKAMFKGAGNVLKGIFGGIWNGIKAIAKKGWNDLVADIKRVPGRIRAIGGKFKDAGRWIITKLYDGLKATGGFVGGIAKAVWGAIKRSINDLIGRMNRAIPNRIGRGAFSIPLPANPIPRLAKGGIVKARPGGTLAVLGEAGADEMVVPLSGPHGPKRASGSGPHGGGDQGPIIVKLYLDGKEIHQSLVRRKRLTGTALGLA